MNEAPVREETHVIHFDQQAVGEPPPGRRRLFPILVRTVLPLAVLVSGWVGYSFLSVEPEEPKHPEGEARLIKTRAMALRVGHFPTTIKTRGTIRAHNQVTLTPQVSGKIIRILPGFEDGAFFGEGDVLVELDSQDFATAVVIAEAQLARAASVYAQEETRAKQARLNWEDLGYDEDPSELVLRLPQLREAQANMDSARAQLSQAMRNLDRTHVRAPIAGRVRRRSVGLGQSVGPGTPLGTIFAIDFAEVRLPIAARDMAFLTLPNGPEDPTVDVELRDALDEDRTAVWTATIIGTEGALDENSLDLFAIARVLDPFARTTGHAPLRIGQPVVATIPGRVLDNVVAVPRQAVRQLDRLVLLEPNEPNDPNDPNDPNELVIKSLHIDALWSDEDFVIVRDPNLTDGTLLATTHLVYAPDGSRVEILPDPNITATGALEQESPSGAQQPL